MAATIERDMAVAVSDFRRTMPIAARESFRAIGASEETAIDFENSTGNAGGAEHIIVGASQDRRVIFTLTAQEERGFGSMRLPLTRVRIAFDGFSDEAAVQFLACFDAYFRRGGG